MKLLDVNHPFFLPRWRRIAVFAFCLAWAGFEWANEPSFWAVIATALAGYTLYALILAFDPSRVPPPDDRDKG